ncbi:MAG TPA: methyltransferase domain-containing protein [Casimicrobiaceae bacterium]|nr:methyltransferase domain-containing protein [Casimicrobiaceae bacterium]
MTWNPAQYLQYEDARLRPALELMARVPLAAPATIADLGCGAGNVALRLAQRWPHASVTGIDADEAMLAKARATAQGEPRLRFERADLAHWHPPLPFDLVYSNAALHWLDDHAALFPRLLDAVAAGGVLAVQMPDNFRAPSHVLLEEVATSARWSANAGRVVRGVPVARPHEYVEWLAPRAALDVWTTEYLQHLPRRDDGEHPVLAWMRGTALLPFLAVLDAGEQRAFARDLAQRLAHAYPLRADGSVLFPFRRLFIVARKLDGR